LIGIRIWALSYISIWPNPNSAEYQLTGWSECPEWFPVMP